MQLLINQGLLKYVTKAKIEIKRAQIVEMLNLELFEQQSNFPIGTPTEIIQATRENVYNNSNLKKMGNEVIVENTSTTEYGKEVDIYFYVQVDEDAYKVDMTGAKYIENRDSVYTLTYEDLSKGSSNKASILDKLYNGYAGVSLRGYNNTWPSDWYGLNTPHIELTMDLSNYTTLVFYVRKVANHGSSYVWIGDDNVYAKGYLELSTDWSLVEIDITKYNGNYPVRFVGGYGDRTGTTASETQYAYIQLKK